MGYQYNLKPWWFHLHLQRHQKAICSGGVYFELFLQAVMLYYHWLLWNHRHLFWGNNSEVSWLFKKNNLCNKHQVDIKPLTFIFWCPKLNQQLFQFLRDVNSNSLSQVYRGVMNHLIFSPEDKTRWRFPKQCWIRFPE